MYEKDSKRSYDTGIMPFRSSVYFLDDGLFDQSVYVLAINVTPYHANKICAEKNYESTRLDA